MFEVITGELRAKLLIAHVHPLTRTWAQLRRPRATAGYCHSPATGTRTTPAHDIIRPTRTTPGRFGIKLSQHTPSHRISGIKLSQHESHGPTSGTKLSLLTRNGSIWRNLRMQGEFCTVFTTKKPSRENFVPNARQRSSGPTQQHTRHPRCEAESPGGTTGPGRGASCGRLAGPAWVGRASMGWQGQHGLAGPAPDKFRMQFPHGTNQRKLKNRRISTIRFQYLKYSQGNCMRNCRLTARTGPHAATQSMAGQRVDAPSHLSAHRALVWRVPEGPEGPGRSARGCRMAGLRCPWAVAGPGPDKFRT